MKSKKWIEKMLFFCFTQQTAQSIIIIYFFSWIQSKNKVLLNFLSPDISDDFLGVSWFLYYCRSLVTHRIWLCSYKCTVSRVSSTSLFCCCCFLNTVLYFWSHYVWGIRARAAAHLVDRSCLSARERGWLLCGGAVQIVPGLGFPCEPLPSPFLFTHPSASFLMFPPLSRPVPGHPISAARSHTRGEGVGFAVLEPARRGRLMSQKFGNFSASDRANE